MGTSEVKLSDNPNSKPTKAYSFSVKLFQKTAYKNRGRGCPIFKKYLAFFIITKRIQYHLTLVVFWHWKHVLKWRSHEQIELGQAMLGGLLSML